MDGARDWTCEHGHVLGQSFRAEVYEHGKRHYVPRLLVYRHAVDRTAARPQPVDVIVVLEGTAPVVECDICHSKRTWMIGAQALERLVQRTLAQRQDIANGG